MKKILITGDAGMLANSFISRINNDINFEIINTKEFEFYTNDFHYIKNKLVKKKEFDITNENILKQIEKKINNEHELIIIHTAAYVNTDKCEKYSYEAIKSNVYGTQLLIDLAKKTNANFVYLSTTAVFDPDNYMKLNNGTFDETAKINPKTIYGLTKYLGEVAVKQSLNKDKYIILKPVFFYGDAPNDNSSMLRKILEKIYLNDKSGIDVLLNPDIEKDYCRCEIFADMLYTMLCCDFNYISGEDYIISRNKPKKFKYYLDIIENITEIKNINEYINIIKEGDYLQRHNGISSNFYKKFPEYKLPEFAYNDVLGLKTTLKSIKDTYNTLL